MAKQIFNPLLPKRFQEVSAGGGGGGEDLAATLTLGNITGGEDIELSGSGLTADTIIAVGTTHAINLNGPFGGWSISSDDTAYGESWVYGDATDAQIGWGNAGILSAYSTGINIQSNQSGDKSGVVINGDRVVVAAGVDLLLYNTFKIQDNSITDVGFISETNKAIGIGTGAVGGGLNSFIGAALDNVVIVSGVGITAKTAGTLYTNQISLQPSGNTFDGLLVPPALSGDQTYTFQDASGIVAFLSDITGGGYIQTATTVNATPFLLTSSKAIATNSVQSFVTRVTAIATATGNVWCHEFRGAIKEFGGTFIVDTVTDEMIAEDVATSGWSAAITAVPGSMSITVTGAAVNIKWKAETVFSEIVI